MPEFTEHRLCFELELRWQGIQPDLAEPRWQATLSAPGLGPPLVFASPLDLLEWLERRAGPDRADPLSLR